MDVTVNLCPRNLDDLVARQHEILKKAAEQVEGRSDGSLKARVKKDRSPTEYIQALCSMFEGSRFRDPTAHCDEWVKGILQRDNGDGNEWKEICNDIIEIYKQKIMSSGVSEPGVEISSLIKNLFEDGRQTLTPAMVAKIYSNFTDQSVGLLLSAVPKPMITLTYMSDGRPIRFQDASPGQQASALLRLLLKQEAGTLIIDQPEDDLDNRVLMDVVSLIKEAKSKRQLIFATHNPNLVVNGDADKVVTMAATFPEDRAGPSAPRIQVRNDGAIETPTVKESITTIMEGGNKAFEMRARRYGHEISDNR
ncbi:AAA family ATPase [Komagataeibacter europaeus]|uniref:AAA family ATPase n=1 Tax=Komagataeibacter europaeus TaxID=33995 RepID=UPI0009D9ABBB|nr:AAA family ATPase [Komagataeibacter europaeus]